MTLQRSGDTDGDALTLSPPAAGAGASHNLLSATHDDTEVNSPTLGSVIKGDATSEWAELTIPASSKGHQLTIDEAGTDLEYGLASKYLLATKGTGGTITAGQVVYMTGWNSGLSVTNVELADSDVAGTMPAIGIAFEDIVNGSTGRILLLGVLEGIDTSALTVDKPAYVSGTAGAMTSTKPTGTALIQAVAFVGRSHASAGQLIVMGAGRSNDLPQLATGNIWVGDATGLPVVGTVTHPSANKLDEVASIQGEAGNSLTLLHSDGVGIAFKTLAVSSSTSYALAVSSSTDAPYITGAGATNAGIALKAAGTGNIDLTPDTGTVDVTKGGLTITAGGLTVTAGGATVTAGDVVVTAGDLTLTVGDLALSAGHAHFGTIVNNTGAAPLIDLTLGNIQKLTLSINTIPTVTDPTGIGTINILVIQAGTAYTVDWSNFPVTWTDAEGEPDLSTVSKKYIVTLLFDGTNYFGNFKGPFT